MKKPMTAMTTLLIFIPGNPSIPGIYDTFMANMHSHLPMLRSYVLSHRGQDAHAAPIEHVDNLDLLIAHHRQRIDDILRQESPQSVYLVGHSLGSAIAVAIYPALAPRIDKLILLCPFLGPQANNRLFLQFMSVSRLNKLLELIARRYLSQEARGRRLLQHRMRLGEQAEPVRRSLTTRHFLGNFLGLVSGYVGFFKNNNLSTQLTSLPLSHTLFLFASNDYWVPDPVIDSLPEGANYQQLAEIEHAFCLQPEQSAKVAEICVAFIEQRDGLAQAEGPTQAASDPSPA